jgi:hypothetical protein
MPTSTIITLASIFALFDSMVVCAVLSVVIKNGWGDLAAKFPGVEPRPDAVRKEFQSIGIDLSSFGGCVHVAADRDYLHLLPAKFLRWFGAKAMSIPWGEIQVEPAKKRKSSMKVKVGSTKIVGPTWALSLANPA